MKKSKALFLQIFKVNTIVLSVSILVLFTSLFAQFRDQQEKGMDLIVLIDRSGSMLSNDRDGLAMPAVKAIVSQMGFLQGKNRILIIPFGTKVSYIPSSDQIQDGFFSNDFNDVMIKLDQFIQLNPLQSGEFTDLEFALLKAREKF